MIMETKQGRVLWFNELSGYGFIGREDGEDVFVHYSALEQVEAQALQAGQLVEFQLMDGPRGVQASQVICLG